MKIILNYKSLEQVIKINFVGNLHFISTYTLKYMSKIAKISNSKAN